MIRAAACAAAFFVGFVLLDVLGPVVLSIPGPFAGLALIRHLA